MGKIYKKILVLVLLPLFNCYFKIEEDTTNNDVPSVTHADFGLD